MSMVPGFSGDLQSLPLGKKPLSLWQDIKGADGKVALHVCKDKAISRALLAEPQTPQVLHPSSCPWRLSCFRYKVHDCVSVASVPEQDHIPSSVSMKLDTPFVGQDEVIAIMLP